MTEGSKHRSDTLWGRIVDQLFSAIPTDLKELLGVQIAMYMFILTPMLFMWGAVTLKDSLQEPPAQEVACWHIQEIDERIFKLNSCTGETVELPAGQHRPQLNSSAH